MVFTIIQSLNGISVFSLYLMPFLHWLQCHFCIDCDDILALNVCSSILYTLYYNFALTVSPSLYWIYCHFCIDCISYLKHWRSCHFSMDSNANFALTVLHILYWLLALNCHAALSAFPILYWLYCQRYFCFWIVLISFFALTAKPFLCWLYCHDSTDNIAFCTIFVLPLLPLLH